jgi:hypothetical protein
MTIRLASLEATLEQLAERFAVELVKAARHAPIAELREVLQGGPELQRVMMQLVASLSHAVKVPSPVTRPSSPPATRLPLTHRPARRRASPRAASQVARPSRTARFDDADDSASFTNVITDPSFLLGAIASPGSPARHEPLPEPELLRPAADAREQGPTLRPGEQMQRTSSGNVVLRRGGK